MYKRISFCLIGMAFLLAACTPHKLLPDVENGDDSYMAEESCGYSEGIWVDPDSEGIAYEMVVITYILNAGLPETGFHGQLISKKFNGYQVSRNFYDLSDSNHMNISIYWDEKNSKTLTEVYKPIYMLKEKVCP